MSIDEAYLDVTENKLGIKSTLKIARLIQKDIWQELHLTASAGVSYNKFLAKMSTDYQKRHGLKVILPEQTQDFLKQMDIYKFHEVGKVTVKRLHLMGDYTGADILEVTELSLIERFGRLGYDLNRKARGIHKSPVKFNRISKSIGKEKTYGKIFSAEEDIKKELTLLLEKVALNLYQQEKAVKTVILKVLYEDFSTLTKRRCLAQKTQDESQISHIALKLYEESSEKERDVCILRITMTGFYGSMKILEQTIKLAAGCPKHCSEVADKADAV